MNKLIKYIAIVFAVVLSVSIIGGGIATLAAVARGFAEHTESTNPAMKSDIFYEDRDGGIVLFGLKIGGNEKTVSFTEIFENEEIHSLSIDSPSGSMLIKTGDKFEIAAENVPEGYLAKVKDGVLTVDEISKPSLFFRWLFNQPAQRVTVTVPEGFVAKKVEIDHGSGVLAVDGISTEKLVLDMGSGSASLRNVTAGRTELDKGSGKAEIEDSALGVTKVDNGSGNLEFVRVTSENFVVDSGSGRISYDGVMNGNCIFDIGSGTVSLVLHADEEDYSIVSDMSSGSFYLNGKKMKDVAIRREHAEHTILFDAGSGRISLEFMD